MRSVSTAHLIALVVTCLLCAVLLTRIDYVGVWDGDPAIHLRSAMEGANVLSHELRHGDAPLKAYLHAYYYIPKALHEITLISFLSLANNLQALDFGRAEYLAAWFATATALIGLLALYRSTRFYVSVEIAWLTLPILALSSYFLLYANYQKGNMPAHALCWFATAWYFRARSSQRYLPWPSTLGIGALIALAVPIHYTSLYWGVAIAAIELVLLVRDREIRRTALSMCLLGGLVVGVVLLLDLFRSTILQYYPNERAWNGSRLSHPRFAMLEGFNYVITRIWNSRASFKVLDAQSSFVLRAFWDNFGPVGCFLYVSGLIRATYLAIARSAKLSPTQRRAYLMLAVAAVVTVLVSLGGFQNFRKLAPYYPFWAGTIALGLSAWSVLLAACLRRTVPCERRVLLVAGLIVVAHLIIHHDTISSVYHARRNAGYMREAMQDAGINRVLVMPNNFSTVLAGDQGNLRVLSADQTDNYQYISFQWLLRFTHGDELMNCLRQLEPVASFPTQASLTIYTLEHTVKKEFLDVDDPLTRNRTLYAWAPVRERCLALIAQRGFFGREGDKGSGPVVTEPESARNP